MVDPTSKGEITLQGHSLLDIGTPKAFSTAIKEPPLPSLSPSSHHGGHSAGTHPTGSDGGSFLSEPTLPPNTRDSNGDISGRLSQDIDANSLKFLNSPQSVAPSTVTTLPHPSAASSMAGGVSDFNLHYSATSQSLNSKEDNESINEDPKSVQYINDEMEPTLMREAAEFSLLSHVPIPNDRSMGMNNDSIGMSLAAGSAPFVLGVAENTNNQSLSTVKEEEEEEESDVNADLLPYLVPTTPTDTVNCDTVFSSHSEEEEEGVGFIVEGQRSKIENPFDSGSDQTCDEFDFQEQDKESFLSDLKKEEEEMSLFTKTTHSSLQGTFTIPSDNSSHVTNSDGGEESILTYFRGKSFPLGGELLPDRVISLQRPIFADNQVIVSPPSRFIATSPQQVPLSSTSSSSVPPSSSAPVTSIPSSSAPVTSVPVTSVPASSLLLSPLTVSQQALSESPLPMHVPPLNLNGLLKTPLTSEGGGERERSVTPTSDEKDSETASSSVATPPPDIPSCYLVKSDGPGVTDEASTLLLSTVSSLPVTPAPSRLQNLLTTTGLSSFPTPSLLSNEIDNLYELTQVLPKTDEEKSLVSVVPSSNPPTPSNNTLPVSASTDLLSETKLDENGAQEFTVKSVAKVSFASPLKRSLSSVSPSGTPPDSPPLSSPKITPLVLSDHDSSSSHEATPSPTEEARASKVAEIRSRLDSTRLNINIFLSSLKNASETPPTHHAHNENDNRGSSSPDPAIIKQSLLVPDISNNNGPSSQAVTEPDPVTDKVSIFSSPDPVLTKQLQTPPVIIALNSESPHDSHMISHQLDQLSLINDKDGGSKEKEAIYDIGTSLKALLSEHFPQASVASPPPNIKSSSSFSITPSPPSSPSSVLPEFIPVAQSIKGGRDSDTTTDNDTITQSPAAMDTPKKSSAPLPPPSSLTSPVPTCTCISISTQSLVSSFPNVSSIATAPMTATASMAATVSMAAVSSPVGLSPSVTVIASTSHFSSSSSLTASLPLSSTIPLIHPTAVSPSPSILSLSSLPPSFSASSQYSPFSSAPPLTVSSGVTVTSSVTSPPIPPPTLTTPLLSSTAFQSNDDTVNHLLLSKPVKPVQPVLSLSSSPTNSESHYHLSLSPSNTSLSLSGRSTPNLSFQAIPTSSHVPLAPKPEPVSLSSVLPPTEAIEVPGVVSFGDLCCVGGVGVANINVKNISSDRWIQGHLQCHLLYHNDSTVEDTSADKVFAFSSKFFVAPGKTELIKVTFNPLVTGTYKGIVQLFSSLSGALLGSVTLLGVAVSPHLQFLTSSEGRGGAKGDENNQHLIIDFGACSSGRSSILPLYIVNHGETAVPIRLTLATSTQYWYCYSMAVISDSMALDSSHNSSIGYNSALPVSSSVTNSTTLRLTLPKKQGQEVESTVTTVMLQFIPPTRSVNYSGPIENCSSQIDVYIDGPLIGGSSIKLESIPVQARVGVAKLYLPRSMQELTFSCPIGSAHSQSVPLKNGGTLALRLRGDIIGSMDKRHFSIHPQTLNLLPDEKQHIQVIYKPVSALNDNSCQLLLQPEDGCGPSYQIKLTYSIKEQENSHKLECSRQNLQWTDVKIGQSSSKEVFIRNVGTSHVKLLVSLLPPSSSPSPLSSSATNIFKFTTSVLPSPAGEILLEPCQQFGITVNFTPAQPNVYTSSLIIKEATKTYKISLCGFTCKDEVSMEGNQKPLESSHAIEAESLTAISSVLDRQYLHFTDTPIKQYSESQLIISNPFSVPIQWKIIDLAPPFVKESPKEPDAIYRANYSVFWIHQYNGHLQPQQETQVLVTFQPQDIGQYSQVKDIELVVGKEVKRFKISMGGKGIDYHQFQQRTLDVKENLPPFLPTPHPVPGATPPRVKRHTGKNKELLLSHKQRKVVYLSDECVTFPSVGLGEESVIKIRVLNKDTVTHKFEVIDPHPPFTVLHRHFELTPRHCARLPIYYAPTVAGSHQSVLAIRTLSGHQMFTLLKGTGAVRDH